MAERSLAHEEEYRAWLHGKKRISGRQLSDVLSRTRRVVEMLDLRSPQSLRDVDIRILRSDKLDRCTVSVKSQLRRAAKLYAEFRGAKG